MSPRMLRTNHSDSHVRMRAIQSVVGFALALALFLVVFVSPSRAQMYGGVSDPVDPETFRPAVELAVEDLNARVCDDGDAPYVLDEILEVRSQVVAGTMLHVTYRVSRQGPGGETTTCHAKIWEKLDDTFEVTENKCGEQLL